MKYIAFLAALVAALTLSPPAVAATDWAWPVRGDVVTPYKNGDDPYAAAQHRGIDIAAPVGTRVSAATGGRVTFAGVAGSSGLTVNVRTADGRYDVSYLHLSMTATHEGDAVGRGDPIGAVGASGTRSAEQPHLHLGVREAGDRHAYRDPLDFLPALTPPATEQPPPAPAEATEPLAAPPAAAPVLDRAPAELTTEALEPLPTGLPAGALAGQAGAAAPVAGPGPSGAASTRGSTAAAGGAPGADASPARADAPRPPGFASPAGNASPASNAATRHAASASPGHAAPGRRAVLPRGVAPRGRAITRADLVSPSHSPRSARPAARAPGLRLAAPDLGAAPRRASEDGLDIGWLAAVVGLVTLAICLGRPEQTRRAARTSRSALGAILRPLAGRG